MMTYCEALGNFKHSNLKTKKFEEIQLCMKRLKDDKVSSPDGDYLVIYRANGNFRAFNYLMEISNGMMLCMGIEKVSECWLTTTQQISTLVHCLIGIRMASLKKTACVVKNSQNPCMVAFLPKIEGFQLLLASIGEELASPRSNILGQD
ncbi:hypothetical protein Tco_1067389 [Tanacetum coccineum]|uniref:Uncharacterized protein n=1 Tax=Tanacetum coccineum TaxID=301880 RepID=A0ABQ5HEK2_9ASTR